MGFHEQVASLAHVWVAFVCNGYGFLVNFPCVHDDLSGPNLVCGLWDCSDTVAETEEYENRFHRVESRGEASVWVYFVPPAERLPEALLERGYAVLPLVSCWAGHSDA